MHTQHKHNLSTLTNEENTEGGGSTWSPARMRPARSADPRGTTCRSVARIHSFERRQSGGVAGAAWRGGAFPRQNICLVYLSPKIILTRAFPGTDRAWFSHRPRIKRAQVSRQSRPLLGSGLERNATHSRRRVLPLLRTVVGDSWLRGCQVSHGRQSSAIDVLARQL